MLLKNKCIYDKYIYFSAAKRMATDLVPGKTPKEGDRVTQHTGSTFEHTGDTALRDDGLVTQHHSATDGDTTGTDTQTT